MLQPVEMSCEDEGIRIETVAAMNSDRSAVIYLTVRDLVSDRLDETFRFSPSYSFSNTIMSGYEVARYDAAERTVTLRMTAEGTENLNNKKVKLTVDSLVGKNARISVDAGIDFADITETVRGPVVDPALGGYDGDEVFLRTVSERGALEILKPNEIDRPIPDLPSLRISNLGIIDGLLHVQLRRAGDTIPGTGQFRLEDSQGNISDGGGYLGAFHFNLDSDGNAVPGEYVYSEYIIDPESIDPEDVRMVGDFEFEQNVIEGNWEIAFILRSVGDLKTIQREIPLDGWTVTGVVLSPINIVLKSNDSIEDHKAAANTPVTIRIDMKDGGVEEYTGVPSLPTDMNGGMLEISAVFPLPKDTENIRSVTVNGTVIEL
jgi:hypothetical protein